jgi:hypothetical protein
MNLSSLERDTSRIAVKTLAITLVLTIKADIGVSLSGALSAPDASTSADFCQQRGDLD